MRKWFLFTVGAGFLAVPLAVSTGCNESVTHDDVVDARQNVEEERKETVEAWHNADEAVRKEQAETDAVRHEVMKPVMDPEAVEAVIEEERETREVRRDGIEAVREEKEETRQAEIVAQETEAKYEAQKERDRYVADVKAAIEVADKRIEELEKGREATEDEAAKKEMTEEISRIEKQRDKVEEELDVLQSAELLKWEKERSDVQNAMERLKRELNNPL